jgi:K(+)-stimulated pyrophosphate-energized sodium pump
LFARVGGGIYTKAADVGADLVEKLKPEFRRMIRATRTTLRIMLGIMLAMFAGWAPTFFGSYVATVLATIVLVSKQA